MTACSVTPPDPVDEGKRVGGRTVRPPHDVPDRSPVKIDICALNAIVYLDKNSRKEETLHLDSARALKQEIKEKFIEPFISSQLGLLHAIDATALALSAGVPPKRRQAQRLMSIGIAPAGRRGVVLAVRVQRRALLDGPEVRKIRALARREVDLRYVGRIQKRAAPWYRRRQRPLLIGCSVGHFRITAGTLGCFVHLRGNDAPLILSNNHVLANENRGKIGDVILQPGDYDGGAKDHDVVGHLAAFERLRAGRPNDIDAATASLAPKISIGPSNVRSLGKLTGVAPPLGDVGIRVAKVGRTTGLTRGHVTAFELDDVVISFDNGNLRFDDQIEIEGVGSRPFSDGGDSGSLIVNQAGEGVGLLFAGSDQGGSNGTGLTYANPLSTVLDRLGVDLLF